ncbi:hypothetical protein SCUCBS95973_008138 [Sporothrix curviconia]|uniref:HNH nuclease domain-containing protein n=1 Tax=Sporothrix curviconia TaxID=1260050 RepID=A0ABP0CIZ2_9PEZI
MVAASTAMILDKVAVFLRNSATSNMDIQQLLRYVDARPGTAAIEDILPADEMDERLAFAAAAQHALQADTANASLSGFSLAVIFFLPLQQMRNMARALHSPEAPALGGLTAFSSIAESLVRIFLIQSNRPTTTSSSVRRDRQQSEVCMERDGDRCVVMGTLHPEVCHIIPFSANNSMEKLYELLKTNDILKALVGSHSSLLLAKPGCSDRSWNMICLNRQLHTWWGRGYFAFRCLGITPAAVTAGNKPPGVIVALQFHWMPHQTTGKAAVGRSKQRVPGNGHRQWVQDWDQRPRYGGGGSATADQKGIVAASYATTSRLVQSGHVINIAMPSMEDGVRMKAMLDIQWACIRIASMSAAAEDPEFLRDPFDDWESDWDEYAEEASQPSQPSRDEQDAGVLVAVPESSRRTAEDVSKADDGNVPADTEASLSKTPPRAGSPPSPEALKAISRWHAPPTHKTPQVLQGAMLMPGPDPELAAKAAATVAKTPRAGTRTKIRTLSKRVGQTLQRALKAGRSVDAGAAPAAP